MWDRSEVVRNVDLPITIEAGGSKKGSGVKFYRLSEDGEEGFPGKLAVEATYIVTDDKELYFTWKAWLVKGQDSKVQTPINMTNHTYWNLSKDFTEPTIHDHELWLPNCSHYFKMKDGLIPTGEIENAQGTAFDFTDDFCTIKDKGRLSGAIDGGGRKGLDHAYLIDDANIDDTQPCNLHRVACLRSKDISMKIYSTQPALVVYTGNFLPEMTDSIHR
jgi:aldose 1-epimerase